MKEIRVIELESISEVQSDTNELALHQDDTEAKNSQYSQHQKL